MKSKIQRTRRAGFTLVELLVVIAIIGILIGMLLPAVQQVREAARRSACMNNMKQLGLAAHNFASAHENFPTSGARTSDIHWANDVQFGLAPGAGQELAGWCYQLLPFLEQGNIADLRSDTVQLTDVPPGLDIEITAMVVPTMTCPSRGTRRWTDGDLTTYFCGDYANVEGVGDEGGNGNAPNTTVESTNWNPDGRISPIEPFFVGLISRGGRYKAALNHPHPTLNLFEKWNRIGPEGATDGTSNTVMFAESAQSSQLYGDNSYTIDHWKIIGNHGGIYAPGFWTNGRFVNGKKTQSNDETLLKKDTEVRVPRTDWPDLPTDEWGFGSPHPGTITSVFGDGSCRSISMDVDWATFQNACIRNDGGVLNVDEL